MTDDETPPTLESASARLAHEIRHRRTQADLSQRRLAKEIGYTRQYISLSERPDHNLPSADLVRAIDQALGAEGTLIALREQAKREKEQLRRQLATPRAQGSNGTQSIISGRASDRFRLNPYTDTAQGATTSTEQEVLRLGTKPNHTGLTDLVASIQPIPVPSVVGSAEVMEVRAAARSFEDWDALYGGGLVRAAVTAQLRYCAELLRARCSDTVRSELFSAVGYLGHVTGFMAFDAYAHEDARRMFRFALACAEEAGDWHLRAKVLSSMARQAIWCGDPDSGLTFTELALVRADRLTATERAMLHTGRARALAKLGLVQETAGAVGGADEEFARRQPDDDPPWMLYYDEAQHAGDTGHALWDTALQGHFAAEARQRLALAVTQHGDEFARARAISQTKLASLVMATGDPSEATALGTLALDWAGTVKSRRAADDLRDLSRFALPHHDLTAVAELRQRIGTAVIG
ncbi:helix-turn-helix transcriptional regulator [Saccharothrix sp. NRRL B-16348]|uniref:helix-turn-helix transcriptional regulator n=1 Tax=Saccharothrix sp. NRRL B-16348 TaxID=1415542 RepID=UPI0018D07828|nr:helix-turn-helix transcriptional regulator [Saccharothrix sp. NRRL B-16348]